MNSVTTTGQSRLKQELKPYVTQTSLEQQFVDFAQDVETGQFLLPTFSELSIEKPATSAISANGQLINNLATVPGLSLEEIISSGSSAVNVNTLSTYTSLSLLLNTAYCGPISSNMDVKNKKITNMASADVIVQNDPIKADKLKQGVNQQFMLDNSVSLGLRKANDGTDDVIQLAPAFSAFKLNQTLQTTDPTIIQGCADPVRDFDVVNKRSTIAQDPNAVLDPVLNQPYIRLLAGDRVLQLRDTIDPVVPTIPGTQWHTMVNNQAITKGFADGKYHQKNKNIDFGNNKGINCSNPTQPNDVVIKTYCDSNSKNNDGTGMLTSLLGGALGGALSSALITGVGQGINAFGQISGTLVGGTAALSTAMKVGTVADYNRYQPGVGESQQLIDNLKSDIANQPGADANSGGSLLNGPLSVSGIFRAVANAQIGLFDI